MQMHYILLLSPQELWEYSDKLHWWRQLETVHAISCNSEEYWIPCTVNVSVYTNREIRAKITVKEKHVAVTGWFKMYLSGSLPNSGPSNFASENQFLWNLAHQKGLV
jgi:hypothetical protein